MEIEVSFRFIQSVLIYILISYINKFLSLKIGADG